MLGKRTTLFSDGCGLAGSLCCQEGDGKETDIVNLRSVLGLGPLDSLITQDSFQKQLCIRHFSTVALDHDLTINYSFLPYISGVTQSTSIKMGIVVVAA